MAEKYQGVDMSGWTPKSSHNLHNKEYEGPEKRADNRPSDEVYYASESKIAKEALESLLLQESTNNAVTTEATDKTFKLFDRLPRHFREQQEVHRLGKELRDLYLTFNQVDYEHKHFPEDNLSEKSISKIKEIIAKLSEIETYLTDLDAQKKAKK